MTDEDADDELEDLMVQSSAAEADESLASSSNMQSAAAPSGRRQQVAPPPPKARVTAREGVSGTAPTGRPWGAPTARAPAPRPPPSCSTSAPTAKYSHKAEPRPAPAGIRRVPPAAPLEAAAVKGPPRARHTNVNVDKSFIDNASYVVRPGVGQVGPAPGWGGRIKGSWPPPADQFRFGLCRCTMCRPPTRRTSIWHGRRRSRYSIHTRI